MKQHDLHINVFTPHMLKDTVVAVNDVNTRDERFWNNIPKYLMYCNMYCASSVLLSVTCPSLISIIPLNDVYKTCLNVKVTEKICRDTSESKAHLKVHF